MDAVNLATVIVAIIAAAGAWASQRAASKATRDNTMVGGRVDMEKEAYNRARAFDTETISRQNVEIDDLRVKNESLDKQVQEIKNLHEVEIRNLRARIARLERDTADNTEEILREQRKRDIDGNATI